MPPDVGSTRVPRQSHICEASVKELSGSKATTGLWNPSKRVEGIFNAFIEVPRQSRGFFTETKNWFF